MGMTCTVTMPSEAAVEIHSVQWDDLHRADYQFLVPFTVDLEKGSFIAEQVVRLIPGRRMVAFGVWQGKPAVAKLFYDRNHAGRHYEKDLAGVEVMVEKKIPTATLKNDGATRDEKVYALIFDRIQKGESLEKIWQMRECIDDVLPTLQAVMIELATQHVLGVMQSDMHMGNFIVGGKIIYTLDGADITSQDMMLSREVSMKNLALFLSQLGAGVNGLQEQLFRHYAKARGWLLKPQESREMRLLIKKWNESRWKSYEKKIFRDSSEFISMRRFTMRGTMRRDHAGEEFNQFIQQPDAVFSRSDAVMLKNGRSSTVIKTELDGRELVIKRYNMKNIWHRLRRALRDTRAHQSWRLAQKLNLFYVNTAKPVAYIESNVMGVRGHSYYVTTYVKGQDLKQTLSAAQSQAQSMSLVGRVSALMRSLVGLEITHGDLKATNILVNEQHQPVFIDLDGAREHLSSVGLHKAWKQEVQRLLQNFDDTPAVREMFRQKLG